MAEIFQPHLNGEITPPVQIDHHGIALGIRGYKIARIAFGRLSRLGALACLVVASSTLNLQARMASSCTPSKCGTVMGDIDIWCCGSRCAAFEQVPGASHGYYLGEVDGC